MWAIGLLFLFEWEGLSEQLNVLSVDGLNKNSTD